MLLILIVDADLASPAEEAPLSLGDASTVNLRKILPEVVDFTGVTLLVVGDEAVGCPQTEADGGRTRTPPLSSISFCVGGPANLFLRKTKDHESRSATERCAFSSISLPFVPR